MRAPRYLITCLCVLPGLLLISSINEQATTAQKQVSAKSILRRVALKYSSLSSYEDDGITVTTYEEQTGGRIEKLPFKLLFKRPNRFHFEWIDYYLWQAGRKSVVWSNGKDTFFLSTS